MGESVVNNGGICVFFVWIISYYLRSGKFFTDHFHRLGGGQKNLTSD